MTKALKLVLGSLTVLIVVALTIIGYGAATFIEDRVDEGEAYGFAIGDSHAKSYRKAVDLRERGEIAEIRRGHGSAAFLLTEDSLASAFGDPSWTLVFNPDWWNDTATLYFEDDRLKEIYRFRVRCELP